MMSKHEEEKKRTSTTTEAASELPSHEDIARRAFEIHLQQGSGHGRDLQDWLQAERELLEGRKKDRE